MRRILNLTKKTATTLQSCNGVQDSPNFSEINELLTFSEIPARYDLYERAQAMTDLAKNYTYVMIDGEPFFMTILEQLLRSEGKIPLYAFREEGFVSSINLYDLNLIHI